MLIFVHKYLLIKLINSNKLKNKIKLNNFFSNINISKTVNLYLYNYFYINLNNYINIRLLTLFFIKIIECNFKPYFLLSPKFLKEQTILNNFIDYNYNVKYNFIFILNTVINKNNIKKIKKNNIPIFIINNDSLDIKYFDYYLLTLKMNYMTEFFILEFFVYLFLKIKLIKNYISKKNYLILDKYNKIKNV